MAKRSALVLKSGRVSQFPTTDWAYTGATFTPTKNKIINPSFDVWQRGTGVRAFSNLSGAFTPVPAYYADQWRLDFNGNSSNSATVVLQQKVAVAPDLIEPDSPLHYIDIANTPSNGATTHMYLQQRIESVTTLQNQTATLSFWARVTSSTQTVQTWINQNFGTGGSSLVGPTGTASHNLTTTWTQFTNTISIPSINGKTRGADHYLEVVFSLPYLNTFDIQITQVQLELGSNYTEFAARPLTLEETLCFRYFNRTGFGAIGSFTSSQDWEGTIQLPVFMRAEPVATLNTNSPQVEVYGFELDTASPGTLPFGVTITDNFGRISRSGGTTVRGFTATAIQRVSNLHGNYIDLSAEF